METTVVYFNQRTHACACVHMVETMKNTWKLSNKYAMNANKNALFIMLMRGSRTKMTKFTWNCWEATSFWVSPSVWESLLKAKKLHFSSCSCVSLTWVSRAYDEKSTFLVIFKRFSLFSTLWAHAQACVHMVKMHNREVSSIFYPSIVPMAFTILGCVTFYRKWNFWKGFFTKIRFSTIWGWTKEKKINTLKVSDMNTLVNS